MAVIHKEIQKFRVVVAFDNHRVGDVIQPTGLFRDRLLRLKFIVAVVTAAQPELPILTREPPARNRKGTR